MEVVKTKYEKSITVNLGNYESLKVGVSDAPSYNECDKAINEHLNNLGIEVTNGIKRSLKWNGKK